MAAILPNKILSVMLICLSFAISVSAATRDEQLEQARQLQLADHPAWLDLLHWHDAMLPGAAYSEVDDPRFFLASNGKTDARAELEATIRALMDDATLACQFPARSLWLSQYLELGLKPSCPELDSWKQKLSAHHLTLLFPSMYLHNPASMFGHTFLRFDQDDKSPLLAYTLSYAAKPDKEDNVLSYVYKGVFGGYPGVFAVQPYYQTVTDYGDIEHRDIWEYSLNLTASEIDQLLNHVWELRDKKIDYFFLRENCSYQLLSLLNVARPGLGLTRNQFPLYAMPADTVRRLNDAKVIDHAVYRPARASRVAQWYGQLDKSLQVKALACGAGSDCLADVCSNCEHQTLAQHKKNQARVLELAAEIQLLNNREAEQILTQRSQLDVDAGWLPFANDNPIDSHDSARWHVAAGQYENRDYAEIGLRPVLHDWLDNDAGLIEGAAIEILSARVRYDTENNQAQLQQLTLFGMQSFSPVTPWRTPLSSEMKFSMDRINNHRVYSAGGGLGLSATLHAWHYFALANMAIETMPDRQQSEAAYLGAHIGVRGRLLAGRLLLQSTWLTSVAGYDETRTQFNAGYQWDMSRRYALRVEYVLRRNEAVDENDVQLGLMHYF
ncbi:MAG TPA: DUF4105 domain-containing protein [Gammaproteobacteria bacterium]|nr:DUF4105 domain-containing protein [Gammaproteobacteria bacterium]